MKLLWKLVEHVNGRTLVRDSGQFNYVYDAMYIFIYISPFVRDIARGSGRNVFEAHVEELASQTCMAQIRHKSEHWNTLPLHSPRSSIDCAP